MTKRAFALGLLGAVTICSLTYLNDWILRQTFLVGNHMPVSVYGTLVVVVLFNALIFRVRGRLALTGKELALIVAMSLSACCIPSSGLMRTFTPTLMLPHHYAKVVPGWKQNRLVEEFAPDGVLADIHKVVHIGTVESAEAEIVTLAALPSEKAVEPGMTLRILSGAGEGQVRRITEFDSVTKQARLDGPWKVRPAKGDSYRIQENDEANSLTPFIQGAGSGSESSVSIPWAAWRRALCFWIPVIIGMWLALVGLSLVVHKQWSEHEHLPYPIAQLADSLLPDENGRLGQTFRDRRFWIAAGCVWALYLNNYIFAYFPDVWFRIPTSFDFGPLTRMTDMLGMARWAYARPIIYFTVIAIAYFLPSDVSLSVGIAPVVYGLIWAALVRHGINLEEGGARAINIQAYHLFGSYLGMAAMILYTGRFFYLNTARRAVFLKATDDIPVSAVWGARLFFAATGTTVVILGTVGVPWIVGLLYFLGLMMMLLVMGRIIAETGMFFIQPRFVVSSIVIGLIGPRALGLPATCMLFLLSAVLAIDPREALMPFFVNSTKLLDMRGHSVGKSTGLCVAALMIGLVVALPVTLHMQYRHGVNISDGFGANYVPKFPFNNVLKLKRRLEAQGALDEQSKPTSLSVIAQARPMEGKLIWSAIIGFVLVVAFAGARLKWTGWPFHPIMFLTCASYANAMIGCSFLIGWLLKVVITRFGGAQTYRGLRPVFVGLVAGEFLGALVPILIGFIYYLITGEQPRAFAIFPM